MLHVVPMKKGWSPEARAAAAAARKASSKGKSPRGRFDDEGRGTLITAADERADQKYNDRIHRDKLTRAGLDKVQLEKDTEYETTVKETVETTGRLKPPGTVGIHVPTRYRAVDYGEAGQFMREKYGNERGEKQYQALVDHKNAGAVHFVVATQIVKEKMAMMRAQGKSGDPRNHHYQALYANYRTDGGQKLFVARVTATKEELKRRRETGG